MEQFIITNHPQFDLIECKQWALTIQVIHSDKRPPSLPDFALIVFGTYLSKKNGGKVEMNSNLVECFCVLEPDKITYEPYFQHVLISNAIVAWRNQERSGAPFDKTEYSPSYNKRYVDAMTMDRAKMSPEVREYASRHISEEPLDFYEWKAKYRPHIN